jgi:hypothetical protein
MTSFQKNCCFKGPLAKRWPKNNFPDRSSGSFTVRGKNADDLSFSAPGWYASHRKRMLIPWLTLLAVRRNDDENPH